MPFSDARGPEEDHDGNLGGGAEADRGREGHAEGPGQIRCKRNGISHLFSMASGLKIS